MSDLLIGMLLVAVLGIGHHYGLMGVRWLKPDGGRRPQTVILVTFMGLLALHTLEIVAFAAVYRGMIAHGGLGGFADADVSWSSLIYFSGINLATLGYTDMSAHGAVRMVNMMQSLGGFMVLTWSATVLYSVSERAWRT